MKKILLTIIILCFIGSCVYANEKYDITVNTTYKECVLDETAEINYKFIGPIINKDFTICIDIPKSLELLEFKLDGKIVDSKIMSLSEHYNRIYLPITYTSPLTISYKVKVTELVSTKNGAKINFAIRDNATGNHIVQNWFTTTILRVIQELG